MGDDGYVGPAELAVGERLVPCQVVLTGHFEPLAGQFKWYGRVAADPALAELPAKGLRLLTPYGEAECTLGDADPWGRLRVQGFGAPPYPLSPVEL